MSQQICIFGTPCYDHRVCYEFFRSSIETISALSGSGIPYGFIARAGDQFIAKARNKIVSEFLAIPQATDLFFIDDDVGWPAEAVLRLLNRPEDIVFGAYPKKQAETDFPVELVADSVTGALNERDGMVMAKAGPTGFMRIKRHVLERLAEHSGTFHEIDADGVDRTHPNIFRTGVSEDGFFCGEDYIFCQNWLALGGELWCVPDIEFTHRGNKMWRDTLANHLDVFRAKGIAVAKEKSANDRPLPPENATPERTDREASGGHGDRRGVGPQIH